MLVLRVKNKFLEKKKQKSFKAFLSPKNSTVSLSVFAERENAFKHPFFFPGKKMILSNWYVFSTSTYCTS